MSDLNIEEDESVLTAANSYTQKYYLNKLYASLPASILEELQKICVAYVEEVGGIAAYRFAEDGELSLISIPDENDFYYDEISAGLIGRRIERENRELFEALGNYYRVKFLNLPPEETE